MGIKTIMEARGILLLAFEENKSEAVTGAVEGPMDDNWYEGKRYDANKRWKLSSQRSGLYHLGFTLNHFSASPCRAKRWNTDAKDRHLCE